MTDATIFHNPKCSTSRKTLDLLRENGIEPTVVQYSRPRRHAPSWPR